MKKQTRRQFLEDSVTAAGIAAALPAGILHAASTGPSQQSTRKEAIVEQFAGDFDRYIPMMIGNGDLGGTFDPFCGTMYDELKAGSGKARDIRTVLLAGVKAQDYWELLFKDPKKWTFNKETIEEMRTLAQAGQGYPRAVTRGTPYQFHVRPVATGFPAEVRNHEQRLDIETGLLKSSYDCGDKHYETELFVHPTMSLFVYRFGGNGAQQISFVADWPEPDFGDDLRESFSCAFATPESGVRRDGDVLFVKARSNIYCPAVIAVACEGGAVAGTTITCPPGSVVYIAYGHQSLGQPETLAAKALGEARAAGHDKLRGELAEWWQRRWGRSYVRIPDPWMQKLYDRSMYYIISSQPRATSEGTMSESGLSASWEAFVCSMFPGWGTFGHTGPLYAGGHWDLTENLMNWYCRTLPVMKESARSRFLRGAHVPMMCGPGGSVFGPGHSWYIICTYEYYPTAYAALCMASHLQAQGWPPEAARKLFGPLSEYAEFYESMLTEVNGRLEQHYGPVQSMAESRFYPEAHNLVDILAPAKGTFAMASRAARRLGLDDEARRWGALAAKVDLSILRDAKLGYLYAAGQREYKSKVGAALVVTHFPTGVEKDREGVLNTYRRLKRDEIFAGCGFDRQFQAIGLAHAGLGAEALDALVGACDPKRGLIDDKCITFRESGTNWIKGGFGGRMPYFHTSHGFFAYAIQQLLMQDYTGELKQFSACPWPEAEFALWSDGRLIEGRRKAT